jgi:hypothetical protein
MAAFLAIAIVALLFTAEAVRRRGRVPQAEPPGRSVRILAAAAASALVTSAPSSWS